MDAFEFLTPVAKNYCDPSVLYDGYHSLKLSDADNSFILKFHRTVHSSPPLLVLSWWTPNRLLTSACERIEDLLNADIRSLSAPQEK